MKINNKKFIILVELIKEINILNLTLIMATILSFFEINKYSTFIIVMLIAVILSNKIQKLIIKYVGENKSIFQSKFYVIFAVILNVSFLVYYFFEKEYGLLVLLIVFLSGYSLWMKVINKKSSIN